MYNIIVYKPYVISPYLTGNTLDFTGATSAITSNIYIPSGFTLNLNGFDENVITQLDIIDNIVNYVDSDIINKYMLTVLIVGSGVTQNITQTGYYCVKIYKDDIEDYFIINVMSDVNLPSIIVYLPEINNINIISTTTTTTTTTLPVIDEPATIEYKSYVISTYLTGNTSSFTGATSAITSNIYIPSGFTLNLSTFDKNIINNIDIINNVVEYLYVSNNININKYALNILIVDSNFFYTGITQISEYCVKISYKDEIDDYFIVNVIFNDNLPSILITYAPEPLIIIIPAQPVKLCETIIYYNYPISGTSWTGGGLIVPTNVYLDLVHSWTLNDLKSLFINQIVDCIDGVIPLSSITFNLFELNSIIPLTGITISGVYEIEISVIDNSGNIVTNYINKITVDDEPPIIIFKPHVISTYLTGNTSSFTGATSAITSNIYIPSGFTLNLNGFDNNIIDRLDIIDNIIAYAYDFIDININKYMIDVVMIGSHNSSGNHVYTGITQPGYYCIKFYLKDSSNNEIEYYFLAKIVYDVSVYSEGYWQDNKVWIDFTLWLDHPIIPQ